MAGVALPEVLVSPAAGPAIFHSGAAYPGNMMSGDIGITGLMVKSLTDGIRLPNVNGDISVALSTADGNGGRGLSLKASALMPMAPPQDIGVVGVNANGNAGAGVVAMADGEVDLINVSADGNGMQGVELMGREVSVMALPPDFLEVVVLPGASAIGNMAAGVEIAGVGANVGSILSLLGETEPVVFEVTGNGGRGLDISTGSENVLVVGVQADGNLEGMRLMSQSPVAVIASSASDNTGGDGVDLTTTAVGDASGFDTVVALLIGVSANRNQAAGVTMSAPNGGLAVLGSTAIMNSDGVVLAAVDADDVKLVNGGILCSNSTSGLRQLADVDSAAIGTWWGDVTGPFHAVTNPGGLGNPVVDGSSGGGAGTVGFEPFIDTITAAASGTFIVNQNTAIDFQFSGGNGTVFLGLLPEVSVLNPSVLFDLAFEQPFTLTTDNGILIDEDESGATVHSFVNQPDGIVRVRLKASMAGPATITLDGPCNSTAASPCRFHPPFGAPLLSLPGLAALAAALAVIGAAVLRRRGAGRRP